ncbi:MAG: alpha/beta hydrolase fold domain-containing protein [Bacteroidia bacterium]|nr:alpha/beta hydrolase fold domain-containing protein [Bacteroidia bacterium]
MKNTFSILLLATFLLASNFIFGQYCSNDSRYSELPFFESSEISTQKDIEYAQALDYQGNNSLLLLDMYYPNLAVDTSTLRPFVLLIHGGGFVGGNKSAGDIEDLCMHLARRGYVCASINYRLGHNSTEYGLFKARYRAVQDGHAAMRYVVANANNYRIDTSWMFIGGQSAGSLTAHGVIYSDQSEMDSVSILYNVPPVSTELGAIDSSGNSLTHSFTIKGLFNNWGAGFEGEIDADEMVPTVAFHGELDNTVKIGIDTSAVNFTLSGSLSMHNLLTAAGVCSDLTVDPLGGHGIYRNSSAEFRVQRASCFFKSIFCHTCSDFYATDSVAPNCSAVLSISETAYQIPIKAFPNPCQDYLMIEGINGAAEYRIFTQLGQLVQSGNVSSQILLDGIEKGLYLLEIAETGSTGKTYRIKILKE